MNRLEQIIAGPIAFVALAALLLLAIAALSWFMAKRFPAYPPGPWIQPIGDIDPGHGIPPTRVRVAMPPCKPPRPASHAPRNRGEALAQLAHFEAFGFWPWQHTQPVQLLPASIIGEAVGAPRPAERPAPPSGEHWRGGRPT